jgi:GTP-binding protein
VLFTNGPELFDNTYQRYLLKTFRDQLPFTDVPIRLCLRHRSRDEREVTEEVDEALTAPRPAGKRRSKRRDGEGDKGSEVWRDL